MIREDSDNSVLDIKDSTLNATDENFDSLPGEQEVIIKKVRPKKKRTDSDYLKAEAQIKKRDEIKKAVKSFLPIIKQGKARDANEADTANIVHKFFQDVLCWDFLDITSEFKIKSTYCDLAIKFEGDILLLIEVKAVGLNLKDEHARQAINYAANEGVKFVLLTNSETYRLYRVDLKDKIVETQVFEFNLESELTLDDYTELYLISKYSLVKGQIEKYWQQEEILSPENLCEALLSEEILNSLTKYFSNNFDIKVNASVIKNKLEPLLS